MADPEIRPPTSVRIGDSPHGRGVIATQRIAKGETIEVCPVLNLGEGDASGMLNDYVMSLGDDTEGVALLLGYGSLYNHSTEPNAEYFLETEDAYSFVAVRDIEEGEEITISYGEDWWSTRELDPSD